MKPKYILAVGQLAILHEEAQQASHSRLCEADGELGAEFADNLIVLRGSSGIAIPDPIEANADWEEFRHFLKVHTGLTIAQVASSEGPLFVVLMAELPFVICNSGSDVWMPIVTEAIGKKHTKATKEFDQLMGRIIK